MAILVSDPYIEQQLREERKRTDADRYDEVWDGGYVIAPLPNDQHQEIIVHLGTALAAAIDYRGRAEIRLGINVSDRGDDWEHDFRIPDVAVFLRDGEAENLETRWRGPADFLVEITSPGDRTYDKIPFYERLGVRELLVVNRQSWTLELYRLEDGTLRLTSQSRFDAPDVLVSQMVPLSFQLVPGESRPRIHVTHAESGRTWLV
jgi:Uma2 family endonuclease